MSARQTIAAISVREVRPFIALAALAPSHPGPARRATPGTAAPGGGTWIVGRSIAGVATFGRSRWGSGSSGGAISGDPPSARPGSAAGFGPGGESTGGVPPVPSPAPGPGSASSGVSGARRFPGWSTMGQALPGRRSRASARGGSGGNARSAVRCRSTAAGGAFVLATVTGGGWPPREALASVAATMAARPWARGEADPPTALPRPPIQVKVAAGRSDRRPTRRLSSCSSSTAGTPPPRRGRAESRPPPTARRAPAGAFAHPRTPWPR